MSQPDTTNIRADLTNVGEARKRAVTIAFSFLGALVVLTLLVRIVRGESDPTFAEGVLTLLWGVAFPAAVCIKAYDSFNNPNLSNTVNELAPFYLRMFVVVCVLIISGLVWFCFFGKTVEMRTAPNGEPQGFEVPYKFAAAVRNVCMIASPLLTFILGLTIFQASKPAPPRVRKARS